MIDQIISIPTHFLSHFRKFSNGLHYLMNNKIHKNMVERNGICIKKNGLMLSMIDSSAQEIEACSVAP